MARTPKRPRDANQLAKSIVDIATGEVAEITEEESEAVILGRKGGLKGGIARAGSLTPERRSEIAKAAARTRWGKDGHNKS